LIAGPGNQYVTEAKQALFADGTVGIDLLAGPSEVLVVADGNANPLFVALDLLSQAEHSPDASGVLVSWDDALIAKVKAEVEAKHSADPTRILGTIRYQRVADPEAALDLLNHLAPEHAGLIGEQAEALAPRVSTAGALFIGAMAGEALGDYIAGPSHVLPTEGTGRFLSGLSTRTFMRRMSVIEANFGLNPQLLTHGALLAELEGLRFHQQALLARVAAKNPFSAQEDES
jgi:histidinol dehydrogenase